MENWLNKYSPKYINEIIGNEQEKTRINEWLTLFEKSQLNRTIETTSILVLIGSHGIGKTMCAELIAKEKNYKILNINLYNSKNQKETLNMINDIINSKNVINQMNKIKEKYLLIIKNCDTITKNISNNNIINLLVNNDKHRYFPIILMSNNQYNKFMIDIKKLYTSIYFKLPSSYNLQLMLDKIIKNEKLIIEQSIKNKIIDFAQNDFRRLINIIEDIYNSINKKTITNEDINKYTFFSKKKNLDIGLIDSTRKLISSYTSITDILKLYNNEKVLLPLMLHDYYIKTIFYKELPSKMIIPIIQRISDSISYSDIVETNIYVDQNWYLHDIYGFFSCVKTSYELNKYNTKTKPIDYYFSVKYSCSDLNKTATKHINSNRLAEIANDELIFKNKTLPEMLMINKYIVQLIKLDKYNRIKELMKEYKMSIKGLEKILKIDKTIKPIILTTKQKKLLLE
jgi:replication factor C subunit 1